MRARSSANRMRFPTSCRRKPRPGIKHTNASAACVRFFLRHSRRKTSQILGPLKSEIRSTGFRISNPLVDLIAQQFPQLLPGGRLPWIAPGRNEVAFGQFEILAEVRHVLFENRVGPSFAALLGHADIVMNAVETDPKVRTATMARIVSARLRSQSPFPTAFPTVTCHRPGMLARS